MLSKFLSLILPKQSNSDTVLHSSTSAAAKADMVTTRSHNGNKSASENQQDEPQIVSSQNGSARKRRRSTNLDVSSPRSSKVDTPPSSKRQRQIPVRSNKAEIRGSPRSHISIEIPVKNIVRDSAADASTEDTSNKTSEDESIVVQLPSDIAEEEIMDSADGAESDASEEPEESGALQKTPIKESPKKSPGSKKRDLLESTTASGGQSDRKHMRFGSEDPPVQDLSVPSTEEKIPPEQEDDEESDDDDAPEEVVTQDALNSIKSRERDAARAVEEKQLAERKKRKEKDARLKKQAEEASKKRAKTIQKDVRSSSEEKSTAGLPGIEERTNQTAGKRKDIPFYLPEELLEDDEEEDSAMDLDVVQEVRRPKKIKFADLVEKQPKDKRVGSTIYRVSKSVSSPSMAPKATQQARSTKENWLKGRLGKAPGPQRKPFKSGFFVSGKSSGHIRRP